MGEYRETSIRCECGSHYLALTYWPEDADEQWAFLTVQIVKMPFWIRLKWALKILFNKINEWEEFIIDNEHKLQQLKALILEIEKKYKERSKK